MRRIIFLIPAMLCLLAVLPELAQAQQSSTIVTTVNDDPILRNDLNARLRMVLISSGLQDTKQNRQKAQGQVLDTLIEERLMLQEARKNDIQITEEDIKTGMETMAKQNNLTLEQFEQVMKQQSISSGALSRQIKAQLAWSKVIQSVLRPQIDISQADVDSRMERISNSMGKTEYLAAEIFLPADDPSQEAKQKELAGKFVRDIRAGKAAFPAIAAQFSKSAGAADGGIIGWVQEGQLPEDLDAALKVLNEGDVSEPIVTQNGVHLLYVRSKRGLSQESLPSRNDVLNQIGLERLDRLQQRYLRDLRDAAFIEPDPRA